MAVAQWLRIRDVEARRRQLTTAQRRRQRIRVEDGPSGHVDDHRVVWQCGQLTRADHVSGFRRQRQGRDQYIRGWQHLVQVRQRQRQLSP